MSDRDNVVDSVEGTGHGRSVTQTVQGKATLTGAFGLPSATSTSTPSLSSTMPSSQSTEDVTATGKPHEPKGDVTGNSENQIVQLGGASTTDKRHKLYGSTLEQDLQIVHREPGNENGVLVGTELNTASTLSSQKFVIATTSHKEGLDTQDSSKISEFFTPFVVASAQSTPRETQSFPWIHEEHHHNRELSQNQQTSNYEMKSTSTTIDKDIVNRLLKKEDKSIGTGDTAKPDIKYGKQNCVQSANGEGGHDNQPSQFGSQLLDNFSPTPASKLTAQETNKTVQPGDQQSTKRAEGQDEQNRSIKSVSTKVSETNQLEDQDKINTKDLGTIKTKDQEKIKRKDLETIKQTDQDRIQPVKETNSFELLNTGGEASKANVNLAGIFTVNSSTDQTNQSNEEAEDQRSSKGSTGSTTPSDTHVEDTTKEQLYDHLTAATTVIDSRKATGSAANSSTRTSNPITIKSIPQVMVVTYVAKLNKFSGTATDVTFSKWLERYRRFVLVTEGESTGKVALATFLMHLEGRALDRAEHIKAATPDIDLEELIEKLKEVFESDTHRYAAEQKLNKIKQDAAERVEDYADKLLELAHRAYKDINVPSTQETLLTKFKYGLLPSLGMHVTVKNPTTIFEAINVAVKLQGLNDMTKEEEAAEIKATVCNVEKRLDKDEAKEAKRNRFSDKKCYHCGEEGHIRRHCFLKHGKEEVIRRRRKDKDGPAPSKPINNQQKGAAVKAVSSKQDEEESDFLVTQIPIRANGYSTAALIDTGASITLAGSQLCKTLGISVLEQHGSGGAMCLGNNTVTIMGAAPVTFIIGSGKYTHRVHFIDGACAPGSRNSYDFIIGNDLLKKMPTLSVDFKKSIVRFGRESIPLGSKKTTAKAPRPAICQIAVKKHTCTQPEQQSQPASAVTTEEAPADVYLKKSKVKKDKRHKPAGKAGAVAPATRKLITRRNPEKSTGTSPTLMKGGAATPLQ
ncbi:hypothetical protein CAEBREN_04179 [Caenorhabditis brenneri]|uniref:CCHC-type domain-containing protein n=1 Tax=Caenorhabditis brenneri TaxID=135651 RepID=G0NQE6_CAEBE|nr:hypothetical protein CAEBREN_04179 [Caenorhabditis brenneri]